jgi:hypothetical protein
MSPQEKEEQRRSFAFGNTAIENDRITRETIEAEADQLLAEESYVPGQGDATEGRGPKLETAFVSSTYVNVVEDALSKGRE